MAIFQSGTRASSPPKCKPVLPPVKIFKFDDNSRHFVLKFSKFYALLISILILFLSSLRVISYWNHLAAQAGACFNARVAFSLLKWSPVHRGLSIWWITTVIFSIPQSIPFFLFFDFYTRREREKTTARRSLYFCRETPTCCFARFLQAAVIPFDYSSKRSNPSVFFELLEDLPSVLQLPAFPLQPTAQFLLPQLLLILILKTIVLLNFQT